jgi:hypothetical protein
VFYGEGLVGFVILGFWIWAIFDVITTDESLCRNLPKGMWLLLVIFFSVIGSVAWLLLGRPENASFRIGDTTPRPPPRRAVGPEDSPRWDPRLDARTGVAETPRERHLRENRQRYADMDEELDRRIEERRLREWEAELQAREHALDPPHREIQRGDADVDDPEA